MDPTQAYVIIAIAVLAIIAMLVFIVDKNKKSQGLTPLAGLAFALVLSGIIFGENRLLGYALMGIGIILAVIDSIKKKK